MHRCLRILYCIAIPFVLCAAAGEAPENPDPPPVKVQYDMPMTGIVAVDIHDKASGKLGRRLIAVEPKIAEMLYCGGSPQIDGDFGEWPKDLFVVVAQTVYPGLHDTRTVLEASGAQAFDENGTQTVGRKYWSGKTQTVISDLPSEARLNPSLWGKFETVKQDKNLQMLLSKENMGIEDLLKSGGESRDLKEMLKD